MQNGLHCLHPVCHVQAKLGTCKGEPFVVYIQFPDEQGIHQADPRTEADYILHAVIQIDGVLHTEFIIVQIVRAQQRIAILHNVQIKGQIGASHHFHSQRVTLLLAQQAAAFQQLHLVAVYIAGVIIRLIDIHHCLGHADIAAALLHGFPIEGGQHVVIARIIYWNFLDGLFHYDAGIIAIDHNLAQKIGSRYHPDGQPARFFKFFQREVCSEIADMGDFQSTESFRFRYLQGECAVGIGHRSDIVADNRDVHVFEFLPAVLILDRTGDDELVHCRVLRHQRGDTRR